MNTPQAHLVDDDDAIRDALAWLPKSRGLPTPTYASAEDFLASWTFDTCGCLLLDMRMEGMSGLDCFDALLARGATLPVIFLTGHGDVLWLVAALEQLLAVVVDDLRAVDNADGEARKVVVVGRHGAGVFGGPAADGGAAGLQKKRRKR